MSESKHRAAAIASGLPDPGPSSPNNCWSQPRNPPSLSRKQMRLYNEYRSSLGREAAFQLALRSEA